MRFARYLREEKYITTQDASGIRKRWEYGRRMLMDGKATSPAGNLKNGVLSTLIGNATASGYKLSEREIQYRLRCARTYETEAQFRKILAEYENWWQLIQAGFPQIEVPGDDADPHDPRDADEKERDTRAAIERRKKFNPAQESLFDWNPPHQFRGDEHGPRSTIKELYAACDESERYTAGMAAYDTKRRTYVDECAAAVSGDLDKTWYEGEKRRQGLAAVGLTDWDDLTEIMEDFFRLHDSADASEDDDADDDLD